VPALADALERRVGVRPDVLDGLGGGDPAAGARFVVARGLVAPPTPGLPCLDLAHVARAKGDRANKVRLAAAAGAVVALIGGATATLEGLARARAADAAALEAEQRGLEPAVKRAQALQAELDVARTWEARRGRELEVLLTLSRALPEDQAFLTSVRWLDGRPLTLSGRARGWDEVSRFFSKLGAEPLVLKARFDQLNRREGPAQDKEGLEFTGTAELREPTAADGSGAGRAK
jgi:Tfp pilus assembly protein PilN